MGGRQHIKAIWIIAFAIFLTACGNGSRDFDERKIIPEAKWAMENRVPFDVTVEDTVSVYTFGMSLRHMENYRYSNLYVFLHTTWPNGKVTHDTIPCNLATPEGQWIGKGSGSMRSLRIPLNPRMRFPLPGIYHFEIEQAMRDPVLQGISDVGLFIEKQPQLPYESTKEKEK